MSEHHLRLLFAIASAYQPAPGLNGVTESANAYYSRYWEKDDRVCPSCKFVLVYSIDASACLEEGCTELFGISSSRLLPIGPLPSTLSTFYLIMSLALMFKNAMHVKTL